MNSIQEDIKKMKEGVARHMPFLAPFFENHTPVRSYVESLYIHAQTPEHHKRQRPIIDAIDQYTQRVYGIRTELTPPLTINIVDHHCMINNPLLLATNIIANAHKISSKNSTPSIVLSTSLPAPDNFFWDVRYHGVRLPFFSKKEMGIPVRFLPKRTWNCSDRMRVSKKWNSLSAAEQTYITQTEERLNSIDYSTAHSLNDQLSLMNRTLWKQLFAEEMRGDVPSLLYVPNEELFILLAEHICTHDTMITRALFDPEMRDRVLNAFEGRIGCWDNTRKKGTHFFWHKTERNTIEPLDYRDGELWNQNNTYHCTLLPEAVLAEIHAGHLLPSLFLFYGFIALYAGVMPLVGHGSLNYITRMKETWLSVLKAYDADEYARVSNVYTLGMICPLVVSFARNGEGTLQQQYALDIIEQGGLSRSYLERVFDMPLSTLLMPALVSVYDSYVPVDQRITHTITPQDLMGNAFDWIS